QLVQEGRVGHTLSSNVGQSQDSFGHGLLTVQPNSQPESRARPWPVFLADRRSARESGGCASELEAALPQRYRFWQRQWQGTSASVPPTEFSSQAPRRTASQSSFLGLPPPENPKAESASFLSFFPLNLKEVSIDETGV